MARTFTHVHEWLQECHTLIGQDLDDLILVTGEEGVGKSTIAYQVAKALDPNFGLSNIGFSIADYVEIARNSPKGSVVMSDEFLANRRKAMRRESVDLLDFLQECRGLNLHHLICFPHQDLLDRAVLDFRVRWILHVPKRGLFQVKERLKWFSHSGEQKVSWKIVGNWNYGPNSGREWDAYKQAKEAHMSRSRGEGEPEESWDIEYLATLPQRYVDAVGATSRQL